MKIDSNELDYFTRMLQDTKKVVSYDKGSGLWNWVDKDCVDSMADYHVGFKTWWDAVQDAVEPYINYKG